jgi:hypothetical protein
LCLVNPLGEFAGENETQEYFLNKYLPLYLADRENSLAERRAHIKAISGYFQLPDHPRHLDVGCAMGSMLEEAKAAGWDPVGVETSEFPIWPLRTLKGIDQHALSRGPRANSGKR